MKNIIIILLLLLLIPNVCFGQPEAYKKAQADTKNKMNLAIAGKNKANDAWDEIKVLRNKTKDKLTKIKLSDDDQKLVDGFYKNIHKLDVSFDEQIDNGNSSLKKGSDASELGRLATNFQDGIIYYNIASGYNNMAMNSYINAFLDAGKISLINMKIEKIISTY